MSGLYSDLMPKAASPTPAPGGLYADLVKPDPAIQHILANAKKYGLSPNPEVAHRQALTIAGNQHNPSLHPAPPGEPTVGGMTDREHRKATYDEINFQAAGGTEHRTPGETEDQRTVRLINEASAQLKDDATSNALETSKDLHLGAPGKFILGHGAGLLSDAASYPLNIYGDYQEATGEGFKPGQRTGAVANLGRDAALSVLGPLAFRGGKFAVRAATSGVKAAQLGAAMEDALPGTVEKGLERIGLKKVAPIARGVPGAVSRDVIPVPSDVTIPSAEKPTVPETSTGTPTYKPKIHPDVIPKEPVAPVGEPNAIATQEPQSPVRQEVSPSVSSPIDQPTPVHAEGSPLEAQGQVQEAQAPHGQPAPVHPTSPEGNVAPDPTFTGSTHASTDTIRKTLGWPERTTEGKPIASILEEGKAQADNAVNLARGVLESPRPLTDAEQAGIGIKLAQLEHDLPGLREQVRQTQGTPEHAALDGRLTQTESDFHDLIRATEQAGTEWGRSGRIRQFEMSSDFSESGLYRQMSKTVRASGRLPSAEETQYTKDAAAKLAEKDARIAELEAQQKTQRITQSVNRGPRMSKEKILAERAQIHSEIDRILKEGFAKAHSLTSVAYESGKFAYAGGKLALNYVKEGAASIEEAINSAIADLHAKGIDANRDDILSDVEALMPKQKTRSDLEKQIARLRREMRVTATQISTGASKPTKEAASVDAINKQIAEREKQIADGSYTPIEKGKASAELKALRKQRDAATQAAKDISSGASVPTKEGRKMARFIKKGSSMPTPEAKQWESLQKQVAQLQHQLDTGDFAPPSPKARGLTRDLEKAMLERDQMRSAVQQHIKEAATPAYRKVIREVGAVPRSLAATADLSATFRQGFLMSVRHPILALKAQKTAIGAFDPIFAAQVAREIADSPFAVDRARAGLYLSPGEGGLGAHEEQFISRLANKIPGVGQIVAGSERHFSTYLNVMRTSIFDRAVQTGATEAELKPLANALNIFSGRGNLGEWDKAGQGLATAFFSPRFAMSRIQAPLQMLSPDVLRSPVARKEVFSTWAATIGTGITLLKLAEANGLKVSYDPESPDFGKIRDGNTVVDVWGGFVQPVRLFLRIANRTQANLQGVKVPGNASTADLAVSFLEGKSAPTPRLLYELTQGKDFQGRQTPPTQVATEMAPLVIQDVIQAWRDEQSGLGTKIAATAGTTLGLGVQNYDNSPKKVSIPGRRRH